MKSYKGKHYSVRVIMKRIFNILIFSALVLSFQTSIYAQDYEIGNGDILEIRFWQEATLNTNVRVAENGKITIDIIGEIEAAGKTTSKLQNDIVRQISRLNARISQAVVRVIEFNFQHVFLKGQIMTAGKHTFEKIPDLWTVINEAGGITEFGDLSRVTIIRGGEDAGKIEIVNVSRAIETGTLNNLPKIDRQDTIEIPRTSANLPTGEFAQQIGARNQFYVIGAVNTPGPLVFEENIDIMDALALAGGPAENANLKKARIISKDGIYAQTLEIDLEKYSHTGNIPRYILKKEDTFLLPRNESGGFLGINLGTAATILGILTSTVLIYNQVSSDEDTQGTIR